MPDALPAEVLEAFQVLPALLHQCGRPLRARAENGLSNRVFRLEAGLGTFYLRLPLKTGAAEADREAEAHNLNLAAGLGLALPPVHCDIENAILVTRAVTVLDPPPADLPVRLGRALGRLHGSGARFRSSLDPDRVLLAQRTRLPAAGRLMREADRLLAILKRIEAGPENRSSAAKVPSHGDPSPGNCLATSNGIWLIDWEFSAMAEPAWDLAYAILEHGFSAEQERQLLESYCAAGAEKHCPVSWQLALMKAKCDAVSAFWALEQVEAGREIAFFESFAAERLIRAEARLRHVDRVSR